MTTHWQIKNDFLDATVVIANVYGESFPDGTQTYSYDFICDTALDEFGEAIDRPTALSRAKLIASAPELLDALKAQTAALVELRDEQTSDSIFGGQTTKERRAATEVYASRIREAADKLLTTIDAAEAAIARATSPHPNRGPTDDPRQHSQMEALPPRG